jgi:hypothetical protein
MEIIANNINEAGNAVNVDSNYEIKKRVFYTILIKLI